MPGTLPRVTRRYVNHHLDSTRWRVFEPRDDDVIVTTSYKAGTTWMQQILHLLVFKGDPEAAPVPLVSPWLDARFHGPLGEVAERLAGQTHRRFVKSHLPLDGLPYHPQIRYVIVARDARDVFMSLWNHYENYTEAMLERLNDMDGWSGEPFPAAHGDLHRMWRDWMTRGWFEWESEGWPFWSNLHHTRTYWEHRQLPNLLFVHYSDLLADPAGQIQRVADFLEIGLTPAELEATVKLSSIDVMRARVKQHADEQLRQVFKGGAEAFFYRGANGRWRDVLGADDLELYEEAKRRLLPPDCAAWLERGWLGSA
jgi:aryl sulfotransferase